MFTITADELPRFMACNGSVDMTRSPLSHRPDSPARVEGIAAHWLIEQLWYGRYIADELIDRQAPNNVFITEQMVEDVQSYVDVTKGVGVIEHETTFKGSFPDYEIRARADYLWYDKSTGVMTVRDFKYGWSIVEPEMNWSLIAHAIGFALQMVYSEMQLNIERDVKRIDLVIHQPRPYHPDGSVRTWSITSQQLIDLHKQLGDTIGSVDKDLRTGAHCKHCPSAAYCPAFSGALMNVIDITEMTFDDEIDNVTLAFMLNNISRAEELLKQAKEAYDDLATHRLKTGQIVTGYALRNDLTNKQWRDYVTPELIKSVTGVDVTKQQIITPTQAKKAGVPEDVIEAFTERRNKGFKLVRQNVNKTAKQLFN